MANRSSAAFQACTVVARNYLAYARVLARSFAAEHPGQTLTVLVIDDSGRLTDAAAEPFHLVRLDEIVSPEEYSSLRMIYDVRELAAAVKPLLLRRLLEQGAHVAMYLDADIEVFDSLEATAALAEEHGVVLTPHSQRPIPRDGRRPSEADILRTGVYNLGFVAVSGRASAFLDWWSARLRRGCLAQPAKMLFVDQRWIDFAPGYFHHLVLRDPGANVAYWNLHDRQFSWSGDRYEVDGFPLLFFHFSGFSPQAPWMLTTHYESDRILLSENPALQRLCSTYLDKLLQAGYEEASLAPYAWSRLPCGLDVTPTLRKLYLAAILRSETEAEEYPPDPFDSVDREAFVRWLNEPAAGRGSAPISRFLSFIYRDRPDLQAAYPILTGAVLDEFFLWARLWGAGEYAIDPRLLPAEEKSLGASAADLRFGVNLLGCGTEFEIGRAGHLLAALADAEVPHTARLVTETVCGRDQPLDITPEASEKDFGINIVCVDAELPTLATRVPRAFFSDRYTVGLWFWEADGFPQAYRAALDLVDEVWVASDFAAQAMRRETSKPVKAIILPIPPVPDVRIDRDALGLPGGYVFLNMFDFLSGAERKNPLGLVRAFSRAFAPAEGPTLLIRTINGNHRRANLERLRFEVASRPDILLVDGVLSVEGGRALMAACDCYVSLHRSEGFGLKMAEAMTYGKPVIATGYSGNMAFMRPDDSYLVDYTLIPIPDGCDPYPSAAGWADPDLDQAAAHMQFVAVHSEAAAAKGHAARDRILAERSPKVTGAPLYAQLREIHECRLRAAELTETPQLSAPPESDDKLDADGGVHSTTAGGRHHTWPRRIVAPLVERLLPPERGR